MIVGIDLGTSNSLVGVFDAGFVSLIADEFGQRLTPSVVHFPVEGVPLVGRPAQRLRVLSPERTVFSSKRFMGRRVGEDAAQMPYQVVGNKGAPVMFDLGERRVAPENVAAEILRKLKQDAERALGESVTKAVVTVPAYFNDAQRAATKLAGELAGLDVVRILNEPTAAALAYGMDRRAESTRIAVYDFGGGTFDVSILELQGGVFQVLSTNGNTRLGGDDIDSALVDYVETQLGLSVSTPTARARLLEALVVAKHGLSEAHEVSVSLPFLDGLASPEVLLSRAVLEMVARPWVEKTRGHCLRALSDAHLKVEDIAEVILVGGSTR
ncbi:MAG: molecular chaperone DnaK, partial [Proteobacteria bacterium]|nr:molecular chaperone DnaK [Pseudomonadota bacterium]